jgi:hypothetical protein
MKIFTCNKFDGHWPVGSAAVVRAETAAEAADKLNDVLQKEHSLLPSASPSMMIELPETESVRVLCDGDY